MEEKQLKTKAILPDEHKYLTFLKKVFRHEFRKNSFRRFSTPNLLNLEDLKNIFWDKYSDYVYSMNIDWFWDYCFKPNPSIPTLKWYIENELSELSQPVYSYYMDSFYPKNNEYIKWIGLFWGDVIWEDYPIIDAQLIFITYSILKKIWLSEWVKIYINSVWSKKEQTKFIEELQNFYEDKKHLLTEESKIDLENNPLRLLNPKSDDEEILLEKAPKITKFLKKDSKKHYTSLKEYLDILEVPYNEDTSLVWDYSYINNSVWEFRLVDTNDRISSGYRYNTLATKLWSDKDIPASGFSVDVFKIIDLLKEKNIKIKDKDELDLFFVQLWDDAKKVVLPLSLAARDAWINTAVSLWTPSMKEQMLKANRSWAKYVVMVWIMEARNWIFQVRNIEDWTQKEIKKEDLIDYVVENIGKDKLDFYEPSIDLLTE